MKFLKWGFYMLTKEKTKTVVKWWQVEKCFEFANEMYDKQAGSKKDHGKGERSYKDYIADHVRGKIAEFGFQKFLVTSIFFNLFNN